MCLSAVGRWSLSSQPCGKKCRTQGTCCNYAATSPPHLGIPPSCTACLRRMLLPSPTDLGTEHAQPLHSGLDAFLQAPSFGSSGTQCPHRMASASSPELNLPSGILVHLQEMEKAPPVWARLVRREESCLPQAWCLWQSTKPYTQPRRSPWGCVGPSCGKQQMYLRPFLSLVQTPKWPIQGQAPHARDTAASLLHLQPPRRRKGKAMEQSAEMASSPPRTLPDCRESTLS